jgi:hypothetical protein
MEVAGVQIQSPNMREESHNLTVNSEKHHTARSSAGGILEFPIIDQFCKMTKFLQSAQKLAEKI